jgi:hypothetical protein
MGGRSVGRLACRIEPTVEQELQGALPTDCTRDRRASNCSPECPNPMGGMLGTAVGNWMGREPGG